MSIITENTIVAQERASDGGVSTRMYVKPTCRLLRPLWCGIDDQVLFEDGEYDVFKLPNSRVQVLNKLPCGTQSNSSTPLDGVLPNGTLPNGTPSRKHDRAACDGAEGLLSEEGETKSEADPDEQPVAVQVDRPLASVQTGAPVESVSEKTPASPMVSCPSHRSMQQRTSQVEPTAESGKDPGSPAVTHHTNIMYSPGDNTHQEGRPRIMIEDRPASLIKLSTYFDRLVESNSVFSKSLFS
jgi:hypothetical protein